MLNIKELTIEKAAEMIKKGELTSVDLVSACLKNIEENNKELNIFLEVFSDAIEQAKKSDEMIKDGKGTKLTGIPIAIKDNILIMGRKVSSGSKMLENYTASYDAFVIKKLKEAGAVLIGRTNMDEFAMGSSTENSAYGPVKNPIDPSRVPGGSSGGSAAAVASGMALGALGSDTGGSIRQPASFCGLVGMKPTYGVISRSGLTAMSSSLDQIGPFAKTSQDAELIFNCIVGKDEMDSTSIDLNSFPYPRDKGSSLIPGIGEEKGKVIGVPRDFLKEGVDKEVLKSFEESLEKLKSKGYKIKDVNMPLLKYSLPVYYIIMPAEVSTNLSRLDGVRYGLRKEVGNIFDDYKKSRSIGFGSETKRRIILGTYVLSHGYYDAYYNKAWEVRRAIIKEYESVFKEVDFVITPTSPTTAFKFGDKKDPLQMYLEDIFTVSANIAGIPAISIPFGKSSVLLPIGIQFIGPSFSDQSLFAIEKDLRDNK
ncbi:MAG: Glutamyl-tRNA(Gln) amidotransferase subunit A [Candidatus Nomurabacteria bacterium GW2011_GWE1_32_28]|uniref:Glutamyl-tRNA(Gln) amidotransferase subunit A n=1 Tax=Candidatus Nomurabacteria bacterium GW2011_GWF1_31_48 TaxID=1618767 RepID=A0A0F9YDV0_9BACT|nr:MAG: Glutamyl-tRNA(Gln) amidotransferase subunit A [Candidatus Nomurabacteria bacterium GW2011_GWF2_30_133]KKP28254.1 MAG: Glutamyl-tRNA(Gln) amidotransferase subunit A [Candidatus Nomurabacteria bacterium GW2011_GWE2_31_40]KKP29849.1 MAG: Glutamyl-tRNA(Gln) amidotransferase subunit A [Candidatus Nomurabacteria bacterium GW2011_GWF1_31_48]KKP34590.1 MAG: Glutamyl-tRNA(Gln) amidotransferase subunit A [Candidatus Nomurabacteria bacterium GW2011_GWE1_32_28]HAS80426.1 Asp-tRNA(Asn)/Glu-tRNA(Gln)